MKPIKVSDVELAFPAHAERELMPPHEECVTGLDALPESERKKWRDFQNTWFMRGLPATVTFDLKDGIDGETAFRHLQAIQGSYAPKHQHKQAAVAYLSSLWFHDVHNWEGGADG